LAGVLEESDCGELKWRAGGGTERFQDLLAERYTPIMEARKVEVVRYSVPGFGSLAEVRKDVKLVALHPHMHARGKSFEYRLVFPNGKKETILSVPVYNWHWQLWYNLAEPINLPQRRSKCTAHFDNSANNPESPDSTKAAIWGQQSRDEMKVGFFNLKFDARMSPKELKAMEGAMHGH
jgi:hypothetical protein